MKSLRPLLELLLLLAVQVFVLNQIAFLGYLNPYPYILWVILRPQGVKSEGLLLTAFLAGVTVDLFEGGGGIHSAAAVFIAFIRPALLRVTGFQLGDNSAEERLSVQGSGKVLTFAFIATFIHHLTLFALENFSLNNLDLVLFRSILGTGFSLLFVFLYQIWNYRR